MREHIRPVPVRDEWMQGEYWYILYALLLDEPQEVKIALGFDVMTTHLLVRFKPVPKGNGEKEWQWDPDGPTVLLSWAEARALRGKGAP